MHSGASVEDDVVRPRSPNTDDETISDEEFDDDEAISDEDIDDDGAISDEIIDDDEEVPVEFSSEPERPSLAPARMPMDREVRARQLVARLRQPFGALLVTPSGGRGGATYKRVAARNRITVTIQENVSLTDLLDNVRTIDIL